MRSLIRIGRDATRRNSIRPALISESTGVFVLTRLASNASSPVADGSSVGLSSHSSQIAQLPVRVRFRCRKTESTAPLGCSCAEVGTLHVSLTHASVLTSQSTRAIVPLKVQRTEQTRVQNKNETEWFCIGSDRIESNVLWIRIRARRIRR